MISAQIRGTWGQLWGHLGVGPVEMAPAAGIALSEHARPSREALLQTPPPVPSSDARGVGSNGACSCL